MRRRDAVRSRSIELIRRAPPRRPVRRARPARRRRRPAAGCAPSCPARAQVEALRRPTAARLLAALRERHADGFFEGPLPAPAHRPTTGCRCAGPTAARTTLDDPYRFPPVLGEMDVWLLGEGTHLRPYEMLGATQREMHGVAGTSFAVWAPNASRVSVVGDFNVWDGRRHPMRLRRECGVWEIFLPGVGAGARYKFELARATGELLPQKADPYALQAELRPATASVVAPHAARCCRASDARQQRQRAGRADEHLRGAPRLLAAQARGGQPLAELGRTRRHAGALRARHGLHPPRAAAGQRAPVRRLLGLPADRPVRADLALRRPDGLPPLRRRAATRRASA